MCLALPFSRIGETIRAGFDDPRYALAEPVPKIIQPRLAALIFNAIVQKCRNSEVFVAAVLQNCRSHGQQMSHVRGVGSFTDLSPVNVSCVEESAIKAIGQHSCLSHGTPPYSFSIKHNGKKPCRRVGNHTPHFAFGNSAVERGGAFVAMILT